MQAQANPIREKSMKRYAMAMGLALGCGIVSAKAAVYSDDFNREDTAYSTNSANVGSGWVHSSANMRTAIKGNRLSLDIPTTQNANFLLYNTVRQTLNSGTTNFFEMSADVMIPGAGAYGGVAFNIQDSNNFYVLRIKTNSGQYQMLRVVNGNLGVLVSVTGGAVFSAGTTYTFKVSSSAPYSFNFTITEAGSSTVLNATTTASDSGGNFVDGYGGFYQYTGQGSIVEDASYDNFLLENSIERVQVNVLDFGAIGNGSHDDTTAFQAAFDASADVYVPAGTYRLTATLDLPSPFRVVGAGADSSVLRFENMGGYAGASGIEVGKATAYRSGSHMADLTIAIKGSNGKYAISTPRGADIYNTFPTYVFERMKFTGGIEDGTYAGLYDFGWERYLDLGDGQGHVCRDIEIFGSYDFTQDPASTAADSSTAFYISGAQNQGGVLLPIIDHCITHCVGIGVQFGYRASNPLVTESRFDHCYRGIYSPNGVPSGSDYGALEVQLQTLDIDAQRSGVHFEKSAFLDIDSVSVTRAAGGYDHADTWRGFYITDVDDLKITGTSAQNPSAAYSNAHVGMWLHQCEFGIISGYDCGENMTYGLILDNAIHYFSVFGATFQSPSAGSIYFDGANFSQVSVSGDKHSAGSIPYAYGASVNKSEIKFADWTPAQ